MMPPAEKRALSLWIGPAEARTGEIIDWPYAATIAEAVQTYSAADSSLPLVDRIVNFVAFPGQIRGSDLMELQKAFPLAYVSIARGEWAEGELRGPLRLDAPDWSPESRLLPSMAGEEERILAQNSQMLSDGNREIIVVTSRWDSAEVLILACRQLGYSAAWQSGWPAELSELVLWEPSPAECESAEKPLRVKAGVAIVGFPTRELRAWLNAAGFAQILPKPWRLADLARAIAAAARIAS